MCPYNTSQVHQRTQIGKWAGILGIGCNLLLSAVKILTGHLSGSMAIFADGLNNLSDAASSIVTLLGFKLAEKPADKHHPYGHARSEYLASLTVAMLILVIGFELAKTAADKIIHPTPVETTPTAIWILLGSVAAKLAMMAYNLHVGRKINSKVLLATAADSRNDAVTTSAVLVAAWVQWRTGLQIDGITGLAVSGFVLLSGISMAKQTISPLLGEGADPELQEQLTRFIQSQPLVIGCHDLMVHDYGPGRCYASIHVEMDQNVNALVCHEVIDRLERSCLSRFGVNMVIHFDPVANDPETARLKQLVSTIVKIRDPRLELHDFRTVVQEEVTRLLFDLKVPEDLQNQKEELRNTLDEAIHTLDPGRYSLEITFDL